MERSALEESWNRTREHLGRALEAFAAAGGPAQARAAAVDYLEHNELELSADALADAADHLGVPEFWAALAAAAHEMQLDDRIVRWTQRTGRYPCPCCGHLVFAQAPGSYDICPICFWEDDVVQLRWPDYRGGANRPCLGDAQIEYAGAGAIERRFTGIVRGASADEPVEPGWRPADPAIDNFETWSADRVAWPSDRSVLYWWRPTYWRRDASDDR